MRRHSFDRDVLRRRAVVGRRHVVLADADVRRTSSLADEAVSGRQDVLVRDQRAAANDL